MVPSPDDRGCFDGASPDRRMNYREAMARSAILDRLAAFDPHVAGTLPLGIEVAGSDIDILCHAPDAVFFAQALWRYWRCEPGFRLRQRTRSNRAVVASFTAHGWMIEIYGEALPVARQAGWRHFLVERHLLELGGPPMREAIRRLRAGGLKTEPAFAHLLGLAGDPYAAILALERCDPARLAQLVERRLCDIS